MEANKKQEAVRTDPNLNPGDETYFRATREGRLMLRHCETCDKPHHYPRDICPFCWALEPAWREASGKGRIYTFSVMRRGTPYCIAYVKLAEGPMMMTNIVDCDLDAIKVNDPVRVVFKPTDEDYLLPMFTLDKESEGAAL